MAEVISQMAKNGCVRNSLGMYMIVTQNIFLYSYVWPFKKERQNDWDFYKIFKS